MADKYKKEMDRIRTARIKLLGAHPFFGDLAFSMPIQFDDTLDPPTAATDGERVIFHPKFVEAMPIDELVFVLAHEVMHPALLHILRRGSRCPKRWNYACDVIVNQLLKESNVGTQPKWVIYKPDLYRAGEGKVERVYDLLPDTEEYDKPGSGPSGGHGSMDAVLDADPSRSEELAADMRNKLQQALQSAKQAGNVPGGLEAFVDQMTNPKVTWQQHLRNFVMTTRGKERTWSKPNRRYASAGIFMPGAYGETMGEIVFAIDCSGSTSDEMVSQCGAEVNSIKEELRPEKVHVIYFDSEVKRHEEFEPDDDMVVKAYGRGGTAFSPIFKFIEDNGINPESVIVATDLECSDYGPEPPYPVMWCVMDSPYFEHCNAPWGQVLKVD